MNGKSWAMGIFKRTKVTITSSVVGLCMYLCIFVFKSLMSSILNMKSSK